MPEAGLAVSAPVCDHGMVHNLYPDGLTECLRCGQPVGVQKPKRGQTSRLMIWDEMMQPYRANHAKRFSSVVVVLSLLGVVFFGFMIAKAVQDRNAIRRCHALSGHTYDSGKHCTIGGRQVKVR